MLPRFLKIKKSVIAHALFEFMLGFYSLTPRSALILAATFEGTSE